jgi:glycosyltransferase involved in cell wall biosynthesis
MFMTLQNPDKAKIDEAVSRAMSLTQAEYSALTYDDALYLWRNLVFVAERLELNADSANSRAEIVNRADEIFSIIAETEIKNPPVREKPLNIFAPTTLSGVWENYLLARDKGYTPYFLSKAAGGRCVFFFVDENDPLPVTEFMPDAEFVRNNDVSPETYAEFVSEHIDEIDILVADDLAHDSIFVADYYKELKPDGKVLFVTDINRVYYRNCAEEDIYKRMGDSLRGDFIYTAASRLGRDMLNFDPRFPAPVYFNSNAYLPDKNTESVQITANAKENIIMTAGRLGTDQKNNMPLIRAFAILADDFPDWKLYLAGNIDEKIKKKLMNDAFRGLRFSPDIFSRIIFTGGLGKTELYKLYAKAKIFVLTSLNEGFPNVFTESIANGCFAVMPDRLDAIPEMTTADGRNIGVSYEAIKHTKLYTNMGATVDFGGEAVSLANTLAAVMPQLNTEFFEEHIPKCAEYIAKDFDYKKNSLKLLHLLCD